MSDTNYNAFTLLQNAKDRQTGATPRFPSVEISQELRRMGLKRTPGTNGEGHKVAVMVGGKTYQVLAIER